MMPRPVAPRGPAASARRFLRTANERSVIGVSDGNPSVTPFFNY